MLSPASSYQELAAGFSWQLPDHYNIGVDVCDRWAERDPDRLALIHLNASGAVENWTFGQLRDRSNRLANLLRARGVLRGDRVGILLAQGPETALAHIAVYKLGAIAVPLFTLFGPDALEFRLTDSGVKALITDQSGLAKLAAMGERPATLGLVLTIDGPGPGSLDLNRELDKASDRFAPIGTAADDPALIIYTSGTTGPPKGALHAHRVLLGHLPGVELPHGFFPQPGDLFWTPADWAWIGGLFDVLLPAWHHGVPVLAHRFAKFDPEAAFRLIADFKVRNVFMPPTALKMMRQVPGQTAELRSLASGGETLGHELIAWGQETFGLTINEFYGQTECNLVLGNCAALMPAKPGSTGRPIPGHRVAIVDAAGAELPNGEAGTIAIKRPDPVMFLKYWNNPDATAAKFAGDWLLTGDSGRCDDDGYFHFVGRDDDIITSGGYRIGPGEIEDCLIKHPAVALAAVVGVPDELRTERIKAFLVLDPGHAPSPTLEQEIRAFVRDRLAAHEYPREIAFIDQLPMTATGKIMRRELRNN